MAAALGSGVGRDGRGPTHPGERRASVVAQAVVGDEVDQVPVAVELERRGDRVVAVAVHTAGVAVVDFRPGEGGVDQTCRCEHAQVVGEGHTPGLVHLGAGVVDDANGGQDIGSHGGGAFGEGVEDVEGSPCTLVSSQK